MTREILYLMKIVERLIYLLIKKKIISKAEARKLIEDDKKLPRLLTRKQKEVIE